MPGLSLSRFYGLVVSLAERMRIFSTRVVELYHTILKKKNGKYSVLYTTEWLNYITRFEKKKKNNTGIRFKRHDGTTILPLVKNYLNLTLSFLPSIRKPLKNVKI